MDAAQPNDPNRVTIHADVRDDLMSLARVLRRDHRDILRDAIEAFRVSLAAPSGRGKRGAK